MIQIFQSPSAQKLSQTISINFHLFLKFITLLPICSPILSQFTSFAIFAISCLNLWIHFNYFDEPLNQVHSTTWNLIECDGNGNWLKIYHKCLNVVKQKGALDMNIGCAVLCAHETLVFLPFNLDIKRMDELYWWCYNRLLRERLDFYQTYWIRNEMNKNGCLCEVVDNATRMRNSHLNS